MEQQKRPSFLSSVFAGIKGMVKGALAVGLIAGAVGAVIGGGLGAAGLMGIVATSASGAPLTGVAAALVGAAAGAGFLGAVAAYGGAFLGAATGGYTGVIQSREAKAPDAQDIINVANISFAQGVEVGHHQQVAQQSIEQMREAKNHFQEQLAAQRAGAGQQKTV